MDFASIATALTGLKNAMDVVTRISRSDLSLERSELKARLVDVVEELSEARLVLMETQQHIRDRDAEIERLRAAFKLKDEVVRHMDAYFSKSADGKPTGDPYCMYCFERDGLLYHLTEDMRFHHRTCPNCKHFVDSRRSYI